MIRPIAADDVDDVARAAGMRPDREREVRIPRGYPVELPELRYAVAL